ncbi:hypothetical protein Taro_002145 [Colocasia esculenta]|uniref:Uncharacterized protein n=1 Tax=Colocasia esculenta TaxID=4460 RepID=A0A843TMT7_COLES|nr:hypothetical protein [Colocasia esculenta]
MRRSGRGLLVAAWTGLLLLLAPLVMGRFVVEKNSLMVTSPNDLRGKHDSAIANFGIPQYGGSMAGAVVYPKENTDGCGEFSASYKAKPGALPTFLLVDRGGLSAKKIEDCMGDPNADSENPVLKQEQDAQKFSDAGRREKRG